VIPQGAAGAREQWVNQRFEKDRVYKLGGDQLNSLAAVIEQLSGLRTLTFNEQRDSASKLRAILAAAAASPNKQSAR
jgi:hypothetical protein